MAAVEDGINPMDSIFHEKQEGSLCAQHCLNALLQGHYFTAVDLAEIAQQLDTIERNQMAEAGEQSEEFKRFIEQPSFNYDDSGFFSIQVIQKALEVWNLDLVPYTSSHEIAIAARKDPRSPKAYICNFHDHWFTIRKLGNQWFNLNSLLTYPELVSDTYLSLLLTQLQQEGYSIFVAVGQFPECEAEQILCVIPAVQKVKPPLLSETKEKILSGATNSSVQFDDADLKKALEESKRYIDENDESLKRAIALSMESMAADFTFAMPEVAPQSTAKPSTEDLAADEIRDRRLAYFDGKAPAEVTKDNAASTQTNAVTQTKTMTPTNTVTQTNPVMATNTEQGINN
ncbi:hypothetical protein LSH36_1g01003 [Paralvinella palmiformis]|uniref:Ataxin-3 homolog n=1 Tax=Paralvinella palmiformis TaxID=53620 RepID=A0AAD9KH16_9ANNE|nr:hypothetical protein LSH36_1g01003 [Paralvinella palmiformis]